MKNFVLLSLVSLAAINAFAQSAGYYQTATSPTSSAYDDNSGNVGIGTTAPAAQLHTNCVVGTNENVGIRIEKFQNSGSISDNYLEIVRSYLTGGLTTAYDYKMVVDNNGNVGIGTATPAAPLTVMNTLYNSGGNPMTAPIVTALDPGGNVVAGLFNAGLSSAHPGGSLIVQATQDDIPAIIVYDGSTHLPMTVQADGTVALGFQTNNASGSPVAQLDVRKFTNYGNMLNVADYDNTNQYFVVDNNGHVGIGMPPTSTAAVSIIGDNTNTFLDVYGHTGVDPAIRFTKGTATPVHVITQKNGDMLIDPGVSGGGGNDQLNIDGNVLLKRSNGVNLDIEQSSGSISGWNTQIRFLDNSGNARHIMADDATSGNLIIAPGYGGGASSTLMIEGNGQITGKLRIGNEEAGGGLTSNYTNYQLSVDGQIAAKEVVVETSNWMDSVFSNTYKLRSLSEIADSISQNHHLPDMPSEKEIIEGGINIGKMNKILMQKIEELTLYIIVIKKELDNK